MDLVSGYKCLALISLSSAPVSSMKTSSESNPSTDIKVIGEIRNFLKYINCDSAFFPPVPCSESLSHSSNISCSSPRQVRPLRLEYREFPEELFRELFFLLNSSVDQRRLESANLTLCRWISGYDYG